MLVAKMSPRVAALSEAHKTRARTDSLDEIMAMAKSISKRESTDGSDRTLPAQIRQLSLNTNDDSVSRRSNDGSIGSTNSDDSDSSESSSDSPLPPPATQGPTSQKGTALTKKNSTALTSAGKYIKIFI